MVWGKSKKAWGRYKESFKQDWYQTTWAEYIHVLQILTLTQVSTSDCGRGRSYNQFFFTLIPPCFIKNRHLVLILGLLPFTPKHLCFHAATTVILAKAAGCVLFAFVSWLFCTFSTMVLKTMTIFLLKSHTFLKI